MKLPGIQYTGAEAKPQYDPRGDQALTGAIVDLGMEVAGAVQDYKQYEAEEQTYQVQLGQIALQNELEQDFSQREYFTSEELASMGVKVDNPYETTYDTATGQNIVVPRSIPAYEVFPEVLEARTRQYMQDNEGRITDPLARETWRRESDEWLTEATQRLRLSGIERGRRAFVERREQDITRMIEQKDYASAELAINDMVARGELSTDDAADRIAALDVAEELDNVKLYMDMPIEDEEDLATVAEVAETYANLEDGGHSSLSEEQRMQVYAELNGRVREAELRFEIADAEEAAARRRHEAGRIRNYLGMIVDSDPTHPEVSDERLEQRYDNEEISDSQWQEIRRRRDAALERQDEQVQGALDLIRLRGTNFTPSASQRAILDDQFLTELNALRYSPEAIAGMSPEDAQQAQQDNATGEIGLVQQYVRDYNYLPQAASDFIERTITGLDFSSEEAAYNSMAAFQVVSDMVHLADRAKPGAARSVGDTPNLDFIRNVQANEATGMDPRRALQARLEWEDMTTEQRQIARAESQRIMSNDGLRGRSITQLNNQLLQLNEDAVEGSPWGFFGLEFGLEGIPEVPAAMQQEYVSLVSRYVYNNGLSAEAAGERAFMDLQSTWGFSDINGSSLDAWTLMRHPPEMSWRMPDGVDESEADMIMRESVRADMLRVTRKYQAMVREGMGDPAAYYHNPRIMSNHYTEEDVRNGEENPRYALYASDNDGNPVMITADYRPDPQALYEQGAEQRITEMEMDAATQVYGAGGVWLGANHREGTPRHYEGE